MPLGKHAMLEVDGLVTIDTLNFQFIILLFTTNDQSNDLPCWGFDLIVPVAAGWLV